MADFRISDKACRMASGLTKQALPTMLPSLTCALLFKQRYNREIDHNPWSEEEACESY